MAFSKQTFSGESHLFCYAKPSTLTLDLLSYIVLLLSGGIYSDTDTGGVKPLDRWPGMWRPDPNVITISDSLLTALPTLLGLGNATQVLAGDEEAFEPPSLVVSLEHDHLKPFNKDWKKEKLSRGMQVIQVSGYDLHVALQSFR